MKVSKVISVLAVFGIAIFAAKSIYASRKRQQEKENLQYAIKHPLKAIDLLSAKSPVDNTVLNSVLAAGRNSAHHIPDWAKRKLQKHLATFHSN
ncbi:hypothetical protein BH11CYA1_BH11CYA1_09470 [soil metagenome]